MWRTGTYIKGPSVSADSLSKTLLSSLFACLSLQGPARAICSSRFH